MQKKRTRADADSIVSEKFPGLPYYVSSMLSTRLEKVDSKYCDNCYKTGTTYRIVNQSIITGVCVCKKVIAIKERAVKILNESNIPSLYRKADISMWKNPGDGLVQQQQNSANYHTIDIYTKDLTRMRDRGHSLFLCGPNGVGKTFLSCAIANRVARSGMTVKFYTMATIIQTTIRGWYEDDAKLIVEGIRETDFLILDDVDKIYRTKTGIEISLFDNLLRERLQTGMPCIFTSNRTLNDASEDYSQSIHSMMLEQCAELVFLGVDHRLKMSGQVRKGIVNGN